MSTYREPARVPALLLLAAVPAFLLTACSQDEGRDSASASPSSSVAAQASEGASSSGASSEASPAAEETPSPVGTPDSAAPEEEAVTPGRSGVDEEAVAAGDLSADQLDAVTTDEAVTVEDVATVSIDPISATELEAGPGEIGGPGVVVPVKVTNTSDSALSLAGMVTTLTYGSGAAPAGEVGLASDEVPASLAPGETLVIERAFSVPAEGLDSLQVVVDLGADYPAAVFEGAASG
ncbi:hypothetical protein [Actinomyces lilanjuaniae]|uniref:hypothetical protein n=1 Tax=Actinomyces lilanjuaniae TaxID=2321394 RepID=UPI0013C4DBC4|nr:hypothetical protein [Actinomyces lilanjuaniae]